MMNPSDQDTQPLKEAIPESSWDDSTPDGSLSNAESVSEIQGDFSGGGFDAEKWITRRIHNRIHKRNLNVLIGIYGPPGSGKTYTGLRIAELVDPRFSVDNIAFTVENFIHLVNGGYPRGSAFLGDDFGTAANSRKWQSDPNISLSYVAQSFRFMGYLTIVTLPDIDGLDSQVRRLFHLTLQTKRKKYDRKVVVCEPRMPIRYVASRKTYWKFPRVDLPDRPRARLKRLAFRMPSEGLIQPYEEKRKDYMSGLYDRLEASLAGGGSRTPGWAGKAVLKLAAMGLTQAQIGEDLGLSRQSVNSIIGRARKSKPKAVSGKP